MCTPSCSSRNGRSASSGANLRFREWCLRAYNQHLSEVCAGEPRLHGVGLLPWWELERTAEHLAELHDLGFRTAMVPIEPGLFPDGTPINWNEDAMDPFWRAVEASGMPLCFHIGENTKTAGRARSGCSCSSRPAGSATCGVRWCSAACSTASPACASCSSKAG